jgi:flavodoxin I
MKALIVYDSVFGNTAKVALAMEEALKGKGEVAAVSASGFTNALLIDCTHLFIGSPTRSFQPTPAIKQLISRLSKHELRNIQVCVFDTRMDIEKVDVKILKVFAGWFGFATDSMQKLLKRKVSKLEIPDSGYFVKDSEGPLEDGELERAAVWATEQVM